MKTQYLKMELLTPVHIGSGETLDPLSYVLKNDNGKKVLSHINLDAWLEEYPEQKELNQVLESYQHTAIRKYVAEHLDTDLYTQSEAQVLSEPIWQEYQSNIAKADSKHQLQLDAALRNAHTGALIVPGSSVKGAIRTVVIDYLDSTANLNLRQYADERGNRDYTKALEKVLGPISDNAFSGFKVGDFEAPINQAHLVTAKEIPLKRDKNPTPKNNCETTWAKVSTGEDTCIYSTMRSGRPDKGDAPLYIKGEAWSWERICQHVNTYTLERIQNEREKFYDRNPKFRVALPIVKKIEACIQSCSTEQMVLRLGHYSQVEYVTVTNNKPKTPKGKPYGTTRTLADGRWPFGWIKLSLCSEEEFKQYCKQKQQHDAQILSQQETKRHAIQQKMAQAQAEELRLKQERIRQLQEEAAHPWRAILRQIAQIANDWGTFKQHVLENKALQPHQHEDEVVQAITELAIQIREQHRKNWDSQRDKAVAQWLEAGGGSWGKLPDEVTAQEEQLTGSDKAQLDEIKHLKDWGHYKQLNIDLKQFCYPALQELLKKMQDWGCNNKNAKKDKLSAFKNIQKLIKQHDAK